MGLISLPIMLRYGYDRRIAAGVIAASGTLAQIIPPSLVLIVLADQLGRSVGDMYKGAFIPGFMLTGFYVLYVVLVAFFKPGWVPALPLEARSIREDNGKSGLASLLVLTVISVFAAVEFAHFYPQITSWWTGTTVTSVATDETIVVAMAAGVLLALVIALANKLLGLGLLSRIAERVTFVLIPPLLLIFLVLGTIFLGIATPTEGGAMGASGAIIMAGVRRRLSYSLLKQALNTTTKLASFVVFILVGSTVFSLVFQGVDGQKWVEHLLTGLPGGQIGFLVVVNVLIFLLAFFLDFFELSFIVVPLLAPVADKLGVDLIWFGVLLGVNMQTSFMHPPFGFALFYLRSVAPASEYIDRLTKKPTAPVTTMQIYWGAVPFVLIQIIMVSLIIIFPGIVSSGLDKKQVMDMNKIEQQLQQDLKTEDQFSAPAPEFGTAPAAPAAPAASAPAASGAAAPALEAAPSIAAPSQSDEDLIKQMQSGGKK
jgi:TRAP-type mannitol/chloroaromatic compound transport system permease large subunit